MATNRNWVPISHSLGTILFISMKSILKFIVPGLILTLILLGNLTDHFVFFATLLLIILPFVFLYIITLHLNELRSRSRNDTGSLRNLLIIFSLLSTIALIIKHSASVLHLPGANSIRVLLLFVLVVSAAIAIFYYIINFRSIDSYVASEYFVIATPILIGLSITLNTNWVDTKEYNDLWKNFAVAKSINIKLDEIANPDSLVKTHLAQLSEIQSNIIDVSGGYHESGYLVNPLDTDTVGTVIIIQGALKSELGPIMDYYAIENNRFRELGYGAKMTVADALFALELMKTAIYGSILERNTVPNTGL